MSRSHKRSLLIAPAGALTALPFHLPVTEKPAAAMPDKIEGYRDAAWLLSTTSLHREMRIQRSAGRLP